MIILASASPRRKQLLLAAGIALHVRPADVDETEHAGENPRLYALRVARSKALAVEAGPDEIVLAADTTVALGNEILGKPGTPERATATLRRLSGETHQVHTAMVARKGRRMLHRVVTTSVRFRTLSEEDIARYVATGEPLDRAGSYAIQGEGGALVDRVNGSYTAVVGLPLKEALGLIAALG
ncbi:Maf-like protein [Deltaproteobacteria bacterium]|nr:Maf-like protein [Deltaproteobacteria bacterium]